MLHQTFLFLGRLWQLFEVSQILEFLRYTADAITWQCFYFVLILIWSVISYIAKFK